MQQIADWLEKLGMSEYAQRFAENRIDFSVLPDLTDQDLEKLGVLLGDRRKILRAIVNLETTAKAAPSAIGAPVAVDGSPRDAAEAFIPYMERELLRGTRLNAMTRHILGLFRGVPGARLFRRHLARSEPRIRVF